MKKLLLLVGLVVFLTPSLVNGDDLSSPERTKIICIWDPDNAINYDFYFFSKDLMDIGWTSINGNYLKTYSYKTNAKYILIYKKDTPWLEYMIDRKTLEIRKGNGFEELSKRLIKSDICEIKKGEWWEQYFRAFVYETWQKQIAKIENKNQL